MQTKHVILYIRQAFNMLGLWQKKDMSTGGVKMVAVVIEKQLPIIFATTVHE